MPERVTKVAVNTSDPKSGNIPGDKRLVSCSHEYNFTFLKHQPPVSNEPPQDTVRRVVEQHTFEVYTVQEMETRIHYINQYAGDRIDIARTSASNDLTREIMATKDYSDAQANKFFVERTIPKIRELLHEVIVGLDGMGEGEAGNAFTALIEKIVEAKIKERLNGLAGEATKV
ncbi:hypothetical protein [Planctopirus hydrillae]|uniref:Uncharacterized protein n=1 Tax=Planctopirus hydrillae TaxID=1841610 RepID=A0A1C3E4P9_9PLAN|nr:hypothetical protein [Planctopirus hydrillae]ODA28183.1 hypothetical protein A6X21_13500 [Planctopirus hydrillae]